MSAGPTLSSTGQFVVERHVLRSRPPFGATEEAWERESLTTYTSSAERFC